MNIPLGLTGVISLLSKGLSRVCSSTTVRRRCWHPTPVLLPGKFHGRRSLVGCSPWDRRESDTTEWLHFHFHFHFHALEKEKQPTPVFLPRESQGQGSLVGCRYGVMQSRTWLRWLSSSTTVQKHPFFGAYSLSFNSGATIFGKASGLIHHSHWVFQSTVLSFLFPSMIPWRVLTQSCQNLWDPW